MNLSVGSNVPPSSSGVPGAEPLSHNSELNHSGKHLMQYTLSNPDQLKANVGSWPLGYFGVQSSDEMNENTDGL